MLQLFRVHSYFPFLNKPFRQISLFRHLNQDTSKGEEKTITEKQLIEKLESAFPDSPSIKVDDVSGGCGSMFEVTIVSDKFKGVRTVNQHMLVNEVLKEDIKKMHGIRILTSAPPE